LCCQREQVPDLRLFLFLMLRRFLCQLTMPEHDKGQQRHITALARKDTAPGPSHAPLAQP